MTLRASLRAGTGSHHTRVDELFGQFDLSDTGQYSQFLSAHARVLTAIEQALEDGGIDAVLPDWSERRRRHLLARDMQVLDVQHPDIFNAPVFEGADALWGAAYVLEGSKMGGALLARSVGAGLPVSYLGTQGPKGSMRAFIDRLDGHDCQSLDAAIGAAATVFEFFERAAEAELEQRVS